MTIINGIKFGSKQELSVEERKMALNEIRLYVEDYYKKFDNYDRTGFEFYRNEGINEMHLAKQLAEICNAKYYRLSNGAVIVEEKS